MLNGIPGDFRAAFRALRKSPGFAITAILTLALGVGANAAIFNVVNALLLASLPVPHPDRLLTISTLDPKGASHGLSIPAFQAFERRMDAFSGLFGWSGGGMENLEINGTLVAGSVDQVTGDYYGVLGIRPPAGRLITREDRSSSERVAVLGYGTWQRFYHGDPDAIGKTMLIDSKPHTIIGVHPKSFTGLIREVEAQATVPVLSSHRSFSDRSAFYYTVVGRLRDNATAAQARAQVEAIWPPVREETAPEPASSNDASGRDAFLRHRIQLEPAAAGISYLRQRFTQPLYMLTGIVGVLLLLACVNLANIALARGQGRAGEYNIRAALGATRWRLAQASLAESTLLAAAGAIPGFAFASWSSRLLADFMWTGYGPLMLPLRPDLRILLFTATVAALAAMLLGALPAWRAGRAAVRNSGARVTNHLGFTGKALVTVQIALSFAIVCSAMLFGRSLAGLLNRNTGFASEKLLVAQLFPRGSYAGMDEQAKRAYFPGLVRSLQEIPGVTGASLSSNRPINGFLQKEILTPSGVTAGLEFVAPGYFEALRIPVLRGRDFNWNDTETRPKVAIVSARLAALLGGDPIGKRVKIGKGKDEFEIVGVSGDAERDPRLGDFPLVYTAIFQNPRYLGYTNAIIRTPGDPALLATALRQRIESLGREYTLSVETVRAELDRTLAPERVLALLGGFFGGLALLLAAIGLYGLLSYTVSRRTAEIGIRVALGATRASIAWLLLREVGILVTTGLAVGLAIALASAKAIGALLYGFSGHDPTTLALAAAVLAAIAALASLLPSSRATRIDPAAALRND